MIQGLLFLVYLAAMAFLISAVIEESISGVVILIFGIPITGAYLLIALIAYALEQNTNAKKKPDYELVLRMPRMRVSERWYRETDGE